MKKKSFEKHTQDSTETGNEKDKKTNGWRKRLSVRETEERKLLELGFARGLVHCVQNPQSNNYL